jgi:hypothetical protein
MTDVEIGELRERLADALNACTDLSKDHAALIIAKESAVREAAKLAGAFEIVANSRSMWRQRAVDAGWTNRPATLADVRPQPVPEPGFVPAHAWWPNGTDGTRVTLAEAVGQALGTASMCWLPRPADQVFDSPEAVRIHEGLMAFLAEWAGEQPHEARRGSDVAAWIKRIRDRYVKRPDDGTAHKSWHALNELLHDYRDHADTGTPLDRDVTAPHEES